MGSTNSSIISVSVKRKTRLENTRPASLLLDYMRMVKPAKQKSFTQHDSREWSGPGSTVCSSASDDSAAATAGAADAGSSSSSSSHTPFWWDGIWSKYPLSRTWSNVSLSALSTTQNQRKPVGKSSHESKHSSIIRTVRNEAEKPFKPGYKLWQTKLNPVLQLNSTQGLWYTTFQYPP